MNPKTGIATMKSIAGASESIIMTVLFVGLTILEEFYVEEVFLCQCYDTPGKSNWITAALILASLVLIYFLALGLLTSAKCLLKFKPDENYGPSQNPGHERCCYCYHGFAKETTKRSAKLSVIAVVGWLVVILIDGDYMACLTVTRPYGDLNCTNFTTSPAPPFSQTYKYLKGIFQKCGICLIVVLVVGLVVYKAIVCGSGCKECGNCWVCIYTDKLKGETTEMGDVLIKLAPIVRSVDPSQVLQIIDPRQPSPAVTEGGRQGSNQGAGSSQHQQAQV